jgi:hypothetical protein
MTRFERDKWVQHPALQEYRETSRNHKLCFQ